MSNPFNRCCVVVGASAMNLNTSPRPRAPPVFASHADPYLRALGSFNRRRAAPSPSSPLVSTVVQSYLAPSMTNTTIFSTMGAVVGAETARALDSTRARRNPSAKIRSAMNLHAVNNACAPTRRDDDARHPRRASSSPRARGFMPPRRAVGARRAKE